jgi:N-glycosylase/DNA lyase
LNLAEMSAQAQGRVREEAGWSEWRTLTGLVRMDADSLAETLSGGQAFRWKRVTAGVGEIWQGVWDGCVARVRAGKAEALEWCAPRELADQVEAAMGNYFAAEVDFAGLADALPWRTDAVLKERMETWGGLRLLRQPLGETLLAFLCSSAKRIPHIAQLCEALAGRFGEPIWGNVRALPTWARLAETHENELRACGLGYRARFVKLTAEKLRESPGWEARVLGGSHAEAQAWLATLPGVGPKIADCVLLFGAAKYEAFPVDTWILKAMAERYGLHDWRPAQVAQFGRAHFGPLAGLAQQFLFSGERKEGKADRKDFKLKGRKDRKAGR